jgi:hypothetical protein
MSSNSNGTATRTGKKFTTGSTSFLIGNAGKMSAKSIANVLHRTEKSIRRKAEKLGLSLRVG